MNPIGTSTQRVAVSFRALITLMVVVVASPAIAANLENGQIAVRFDDATGAVVGVRNKSLNLDHPQNGIGFRIDTDRGIVRSEKPIDVKKDGETLAMQFLSPALKVTLHYHLGKDDAFYEKWVSIEVRDGRPILLKSLTLEDANTGDSFKDIHFHDDQTKWHCPINLLLRGDKGGCFAGLAYPYWDFEQRGDKGFRLGFEPYYTLQPDETFVSERYFHGVYANEGIYRYSHGPFPGDAPPKWLTFNNASVTLYSADTSDVPGEVLDWGEVWAMQKYMRHVLPRHPMPDDGYFMWVNSWWAWAYKQGWSLGRKEIDMLASVGVKDVMTQSLWFGHGQHPKPVSYIVQMDPGKPPRFQATSPVQQLWDYGQSKGVNVSSFCCPGVYFDSKPQWLGVRQDGSPQMYNIWSRLNCFAVDEHARFMLSLYDRIFDEYDCRYWGFDGRWLSVCEFPYEDEDRTPMGLNPCFGKGHGHIPGHNLYKEWRNIHWMLGELRKRRPRMCMETYYGVRRGGPWALRHLNATENYYELASADQLRYQCWFNQNDRFFPPDRNMAMVFGRDVPAFRVGLISAIACAPYCQIGAGMHQLVHAEARGFLDAWRTWASDHLEYLHVKRDLFACPGYGRIDGSAHVIGDRGFIFLFPTGIQPNTHTPSNDEGLKAKLAADNTVLRAAVKINRWIGLDESRDAKFEIREIFPREDQVIGTYGYSDELLYDVPNDSPVILKVMPVEPDAERSSGGFDPDAKNVHISHAFVENIFRAGEFTSLTNEQRVERFFDTSNWLTRGSRAGRVNEVDGLAAENLQFDKFDQFAESSTNLGDLRLTAPATFALWFNASDVQSDRRLLSQGTGQINQGGALRVNDGKVQVWSGSTWVTIVGEVKANQWQHLAIVFRPDGTVDAYLNGKHSGSAECRCDFHRVEAVVGGKFLGQHGEPFVGRMDDIYILRRAMSANDVAKMFESQQGGRP